MIALMLHADKTKTAPLSEDVEDASAVSAVTMSISELCMLVHYSRLLDAISAQSNDTFPSLQPEVIIMVPAKELERFRAYQKAPFRYGIEAPFGLRADLRQILRTGARAWRVFGVIAGVMLFFMVMPFAFYAALCCGIAATDPSFDLGAALAKAYLP